jgi:hypothetical protein
MVLMAYAVEAATGTDVRLSAEARQTAQGLQQAGYRAEDVALFADEVFPRRDWRGQKGEKPTLRALTDGIAIVRHERVPSYAINEHSLVYRVKALREHLPAVVHIHTLADLWSAAVRRAIVEAEVGAQCCPDCHQAMRWCECGEVDWCRVEQTKFWRLARVDLWRALDPEMFDGWLKNVRMVGFELAVDGPDCYILECKDEQQRAWLVANLLQEIESRLAGHARKPVHIELWVRRDFGS